MHLMKEIHRLPILIILVVCLCVGFVTAQDTAPPVEFQTLEEFRAMTHPDLIPHLERVSEVADPSQGVSGLPFDEAFTGLIDFYQPEDLGITVRDTVITTWAGQTTLYIYEPTAVEGIRPGILWIHGGGFIAGSGRDDLAVLPLVANTGATVVSVDYHLAPANVFPSALEDVFAALVWMKENAAELNIDLDRIAIAGASAGGGLAATLAQKNRDWIDEEGQRIGPEVVLQVLIYPAVDDQHDNPAGREITYPPVWNRQKSDASWSMYLGQYYGAEEIPPYAVASRMDDLSGLPPAYIFTGTPEVFRDDIIDYAQRLMAANVPTELVVYYGAFHGFDLYNAPISEQARQGMYAALNTAFGQ